MIRNAKNLSPDQKSAIESILGRSLGENEEISVQTVTTDDAPAWLQDSWRAAEGNGLDKLSIDEIDAEIAAARRDRNGGSHTPR
jgi:hypothetical protein